MVVENNKKVGLFGAAMAQERCSHLSMGRLTVWFQLTALHVKLSLAKLWTPPFFISIGQTVWSVYDKISNIINQNFELFYWVTANLEKV